MLCKCSLAQAKETLNIENFLGPTGPRRIRRFFGTYGSISQGPPTPPAHRGPPDFTITSYLTYGCAMISAPQGRKFWDYGGSGGHPSMVGGSLNVPNVKQYPVCVPNVKHPLWVRVIVFPSTPNWCRNLQISTPRFCFSKVLHEKNLHQGNS